MIVLWMLYCVGVSILLALSALVLEHGMRLRGLPLRWVWIGALLGSVSLAAAPWFASPDAQMHSVSASALAENAQSGWFSESALMSQASGMAGFTRDDLDRPLLLLWGLLSGSAFVFLGGAVRHLGSRRRTWRSATVDGVPALISRSVGPAAIGLLNGTIVLPEWALALEPENRRLVIAHEREHVRAGDTSLLALGAVAVALMPWNAPIWWQLRRLRGGIELDCDARVLKGGHDIRRYGRLLVEIGVRRSAPSVAFATFSGSRPLLERRIQTMLTPRPRNSNAGLTASSLIALVLFAFACEAPQPTVPQFSPQAPVVRVQASTPEVDTRVTINRISKAPAMDGKQDLITLEVKEGPSYAVNHISVPIAALETFIASAYELRPRKVLFVQADPQVSDSQLAAAIEYARAGLSEALEAAKHHGGRPGESAAINVVVPPARSSRMDDSR